MLQPPLHICSMLVEGPTITLTECLVVCCFLGSYQMMYTHHEQSWSHTSVVAEDNAVLRAWTW